MAATVAQQAVFPAAGSQEARTAASGMAACMVCVRSTLAPATQLQRPIFPSSSGFWVSEPGCIQSRRRKTEGPLQRPHATLSASQVVEHMPPSHTGARMVDMLAARAAGALPSPPTTTLPQPPPLCHTACVGLGMSRAKLRVHRRKSSSSSWHLRPG